MEQAMLITPHGEKIVLPPEIYLRVMEMLTVERPAPVLTPEELEALIKQTMGSLAGGPSLTQALLESRREEREREDRRERERRKRIAAKAKRAA